MESRTSPGKKGSVPPISGFLGDGVCHWLLLCTLGVPVWLSRVGNGQDDRPFFLWRLVFSGGPYPLPACFCLG